MGTIVDDEPRISISDVTKAEGKKGQTTLFTFTVTLSAADDQQAVQWMQKNQPKNKELLRFRVEAAELLMIADKAKPKSDSGSVSVCQFGGADIPVWRASGRQECLPHQTDALPGLGSEINHRSVS